jgi:hypothetical protein
MASKANLIIYACYLKNKRKLGLFTSKHESMNRKAKLMIISVILTAEKSRRFQQSQVETKYKSYTFVKGKKIRQHPRESVFWNLES